MVSSTLAAFFAVLVLSVSYALLKGGKPEQIGALIIVAMTALQFVSLAFQPRYYSSVDLASVIVDAFGVVGFGVLAVYAHRMWPIWAASLQLLSLSSHFSREVDVHVQPLVYVAMKSGPTFLVLLALLLGTSFHRHRVRMRGSDRAWTEW